MANNVVDLFSYLPGLKVTETELLEAELISQQILQAQYPDMDLREGTAIRDLVLRPNATLLALVNKAILYYFSQNTIEGVDDTTTPAFVDKLMSNWFLTRKPGSKAIINVRLAFARQKSIVISADSFFSVDGETKFYPQNNVSLSPEDLTFDPYNNEFFVNLDLVAEQDGTIYNISSGSLLYFSNFDPYFLHGEINYLRQTAANSESNTQFLSRANTAISTRNLINNPSIISNLLEAFPLMDYVYPVGYGDEEMIRDQVKVVVPDIADPIWVRMGGDVDVYCRLPLASSKIQVTTDADGKAFITGAIYKISRSSISAGTLDDTISSLASFTVYNPNVYVQNVSSASIIDGYLELTIPDHGIIPNRSVTILGANQSECNGNLLVDSVTKDIVKIKLPVVPVGNAVSGTLTCEYVIPSKDFGFSDRQELVVDFGSAEANKTATFDVFYFQGIDGIQNYLEAPVRKVLCGDLLARGFNIYLLDISITAYNGPTPSSDEAFKVIETYLKSLNPGETFVMSDLLSNLYAAGIKTIQTPLDITYTKYTRDLLAPTTGVILDTLNPNDATATFLVNTVTTNSTTA